MARILTLAWTVTMDLGEARERKVVRHGNRCLSELHY